MTTNPSSDWDRVLLGDVVNLKRGYDLPSKERRDGSVPIVSSSGVTGYHDEAKVAPPGVVTGRYGTLGQVFYVEEEFWPLNTALYVQDFKGNDPRWVSYLLMVQGFGGRSGAAAVPGVNRNVLHGLPVLRPPLDTQRKIAAALSAYDDLVENNTRRIQALEEIAQAIYREWFVEFRFPGHEVVPLAKSDLGPIPKGWRVARLADCVSTQYGYTESATSEQVGPKFLRGMDINKTSYIDWSQVPYCRISDSDLEKYRLSRGDVVIIRMADPGKVGIIEAHVDAVFASYLVRLRPIDEDVLRPYFLFHYLTSDRYQSFVVGASTGTTRRSVSAKVMTGVPLALPPLQIQDSFVDQVGAMRDLIRALLETNANLRATRDFLLPHLLSGKVDVSSLDIDTVGLVA